MNPKMDKFINDNYMTPGDKEKRLHPKRADNVKIVEHPVSGKVLVCPDPPSYFSELQEDAKKLRPKKSPSKFLSELDKRLKIK